MSKRTSTWLGIALCLAISLTVGAPAVATDPDAKGVLTGTAWVLESLGSGEALDLPAEDVRITLHFGTERMATGTAGCNSYMCDYQLGSGALTFGPIGATLKMCPDDVMDFEGRFLRALEGASRYEISGQRLLIYHGEGEETMVLVTPEAAALGAEASGEGVEGAGADEDSGVPDGFEYIVAAGDYLSKIAKTYYDDGDAWADIVAATKAKAAVDDLYRSIRNANVVTVGQRLWLPIKEGMKLRPQRSTWREQPFVERMINTTYPSAFTASGRAPLVDSEYREPAAPGSAAEVLVRFERYARGDLNGDGVADAAVLLVTEPGGGSGTFYELGVVLNCLDRPAVVGTTLLGDRVQVETLEIVDGEVIVELKAHGPDDPMCCPTSQVSRRYGVQVSMLGQTVQTTPTEDGAGAE